MNIFKSAWEFLGSTTYVLLASIILAVLFPGFGGSMEFLIVPLLVMLLAFSLLSLRISVPENHMKTKIFVLLFFNFILMSFFFYLMSLVITNEFYSKGILMYLAMPPALATVTFSFILKGDVKIAYGTLFVSYLISLVYTPVVAYFFFREEIEVARIIRILVLMIILPFLLSRLINTGLFKKGIVYNGREMVNLFMLLANYIAFSLAMPNITKDIPSLFFLAALFCTYNLAYIETTRLISKKLKISKELEKEVVLFGILKNGGLAIAFCLLLLPAATIVPIVVHSFVTIATQIYLVEIY